MAQAQRKIDATRILNKVFTVYSRLASYQDEGILVTTNDEATGGAIEKCHSRRFSDVRTYFGLNGLIMGLRS
jgi:hypothetical protein